MDIRPVSDCERNLGSMDFFLLWAGVAISLAEIWAGGLLVPMGFGAAMAAILLGHVVGNTLMALGGVMGSNHGITSMVSVRPAFGILGSNLAAVLNIIQLISWASIMLIIGGRAGGMLGAPSGGALASDRFWIVLIGLGTLLWALLTGRRIWKAMQVAAVAGLVLVLGIMTWQAYRRLGSVTPSAVGSASMPFMTGLDLVIAMPISWMPLVSDYSRFAKRTSTAFWSTWWGYFLVSSWMYALGLTASLWTASAEPHLQLLELLGGLGMVTPALLTVVFSTITSDFPDLYSATCSFLNISGKIGAKTLMGATGILSIVLALVFPMERYQGFLFFIGAMFVPLYGVVLTDYFLVRRRRLELDALDRVGGAYWYSRGYHRPALLAWAAGFATYEAIQLLEAPWGGSIPSMIAAGALYYAAGKRSTALSRSQPE
jgi:putative hydroxymethylpyrimidine transporter CytX